GAGEPGARSRSGLVDRVFRIPDVQQRADLVVLQLVTALQPGFDGGALLLVDRATLGQADQTVVFATHVIQTIAGNGLVEELIDEIVESLVAQVGLEVQGQLEAQLLKFIDTELLAQTAGTVGRHETILKGDNARHSSSFAGRAPVLCPERSPSRPNTCCLSRGFQADGADCGPA